MALSEYDIEQLDRYLEGTLTAEQSQAIADRIAIDQEYRQLHDDLLLLPEALLSTDIEERHQLLRDIEDQTKWPSEDRNKKTKNTIPRLNRIVSIAAAVLLLIAAGWWWQRPTDLQKDIATLYQKYETPPVARPEWIVITRSTEKTMDNIDPELIRGYNLYEVGLYAEAAEALEEYYEKTDDQEALYYAGISYAATGDINKAKECLNMTTHPKEGEFINELLKKIKE